MSSLLRFLFTLAAASLLAASLRRRAPPSDLRAQLVPSSHIVGRNRSFVLWLHGLGDSGPANEPIRTFFSAPEFRLTKWAFPSAPNAPVSCNHGAVMPSWFDIHELPMTAGSPQDESGVLKAVENVHAMINKEVVDGVHPENIFVCGFSQGGALTLASVLLYPKTLGGRAVFSGWVPFGSSVIERISSEARKTPILWSHGMADRTVLFEAGQAGPPFLQSAGVSCEFEAYPDLGHSISKEELHTQVVDQESSQDLSREGQLTLYQFKSPSLPRYNKMAGAVMFKLYYLIFLTSRRSTYYTRLLIDSLCPSI